MVFDSRDKPYYKDPYYHLLTQQYNGMSQGLWSLITWHTTENGRPGFKKIPNEKSETIILRLHVKAWGVYLWEGIMCIPGTCVSSHF